MKINGIHFHLMKRVMSLRSERQKDIKSKTVLSSCNLGCDF